MRTIAISLIIALGLFSGVSCGWAAGDTVGEGVSLSLVKARALAFENNRDIKIQEQEVAAARAGITGARGGFLPKLNASAGYTRNGSVLSTAQPSNAKKDPGIFTGYKSDNQTGLELEQSLYSGGATAANFQQSQLSLKIQQEVLRGRKLDVAFEVNRLYYGLLLAYETERITKNLLDQATLHYQEVKLKYEQGTASRFDLLQSKVQVSKLMPERIKAQNAVELVGAELKNLLGMKMPDAFTLTD
ncbi:MAG: TolC family protein, partial [Candidatus Omnitrophica bacterium]|nr:TolC family protein [Candidatus Omnitrophota bacterium]